MHAAVAPRPASLTGAARRHGVAAAALGLCLAAVAALYVSVSVPPAAVTGLFEGVNGLSGEDAALRQLYDADGERVPGAVIASQALAAADMPDEARRAVRRARQNLEDVRRAATAAAMLKAEGAGGASSDSASGVDAAWKVQMDKAMGVPSARKRVSSGSPATASSVAARMQEAAQREQSSDMLKEQMETLMRRKMSEMKLDVSRKLRLEREHHEKEERRTKKAAHVEVEALQKRMLKQREKMEEKIVELKTAAHHFKSEAETMAVGSDPDALLEEKAASPRRQEKRASSRGQSSHSVKNDEEVSTPAVAQDATEKKLEAEVRSLKAEFAKDAMEKKLEEEVTSLKAKVASKQEALFRSAKAPVAKEGHVKSNSAAQVKGSGDAADAHKIEKIEESYFRGTGASAGVARAKMENVVAEQEARKAAKSKKLKMQKMHLQVVPTAVATPVSYSLHPTSGAGGEARSSAPTVGVPAMIHAAREQQPRRQSGDAELEAQLQSAIAERNAAEVTADAYVMRAKDREIDELENELAVNQRVLALNQMQEERQGFDGQGGLILPGLAQRRQESLDTPFVGLPSIGHLKEAWSATGGQRIVFPEQERGTERGKSSGDVAMASTLAKQRIAWPSPAWEDRGVSPQRAVNYGDASASMGQHLRMKRPGPSLALTPQRVAEVYRPSSGGSPVDHVPEWSARVRALEDKALEHGFQLVPAHAGQEHIQRDTYGVDRVVPSPAGSVAPERQALAAVKVPHKAPTVAKGVSASPDAVQQAQRAEKVLASPARKAKEAPLILKTASAHAGSSKQVAQVPQGLDGASLLDQIGREFYRGATSIFKAV